MYTTSPRNTKVTLNNKMLKHYKITDIKMYTMYINTLNRVNTLYKDKQDAQLSQRDRAAGCVTVFALQFSPKVEDWNWETIFYGHYRSIFNHNRPENLSNSVKK